MPGRLKINTDAAFSDESKQGATSCIIRDHRGGFYAAQAKWYGEAMMRALWRRWHVEIVQSVVTENDCLQLV
jgi:hypothetical protein